MKNTYKRSKQNLLIGFGFSLVILILSSGLSYFSILQLLDSQQMVDHTTRVESSMEKLISRMKDAETGQRGFLLTNEDAFLEPYNGAKTDVMELLSETQLLTRDNDSQQNDFPKLEKYIGAKFDLIALSIKEKRRGIPPTASALLDGKSTMDSVRAVVATMVNREHVLMVERNTNMNKFATYTPIFIGIAALISMVITILFYFRVQRDARVAIRLQEELLTRENDKQRQIIAIGDVAEKIAKGNYTARIDEDDLR
ncbi:MAG: hypothetical protein EOO92_07855 [Pedobacter sp.]|nr:MAG: hypothetical protein EOO92_07855 [Pedobacter sp.]